MTNRANDTRPLSDRVVDRARETGDMAASSAETLADRTRHAGDAAASSVENVADKARDLGDKAANAVQNVTDQARDAASTARDKASELADTASDKADAAMTSTGVQMKNLAQTVREKAPEGTVGEYATQAANVLERGGQYLQEADVQTVRTDLETVIRQHPIESLLVGLGVGFLLARATRR
jgi:ElaB/YqjD/DUF883 family membrane-anchored ribosome-binding protein